MTQVCYFQNTGADTHCADAEPWLVICRQAGVPYSNDFHMVIRQNGDYFGLFTFVEDTDDTYLLVSSNKTCEGMHQEVVVGAICHCYVLLHINWVHVFRKPSMAVAAVE